ncbi:MAG: MobA/MobL family protein, partial [Gammaproteobacteria bacterium]|nr:MobA/MobL family protein [Gammaproteobacteria bacterium]
MAIYHLSAKLVQRSKGHNVVAAAAYRHAAKMHAEKEVHTFDFSNKQDVIFGEVLLPDNAPDWIKQLNQFPTLINEATNNSSLVSYNKEAVSAFSEKLWNVVENLEVRKDAQLARDIEFSLPKELMPEQSVALAREFLKDQLCGRGMVADWSFHNDEGNPHVHVLVSLRSLATEGFGQKVRAWNAKSVHQTLREQWAAYANYHLKMHQHDVTIDHRSYEAQGIDLIPTQKEGKAIRQMRERGIPTERMSEASAIKQENLTRIVQNPQILFDKMTKTKPTFTQDDVAHEMGRYVSDKQTVSYKSSLPDKGLMAEIALNTDSSLTDAHEINQVNEPALSTHQLAMLLEKIEKHDSVFSEKTLARALSELTDNADLLAKALIEIKASSELIYLGAGDDGRNRYTTRHMFELENRLQTLADKWGEHTHLKLNTSKQKATLAKYERQTGKVLTEEQQRAVKHILSGSGISCLVGRAGTGKSFSLGAARAVWEAQGMRVLGIALSGKAADSLAQDAGIDSRTIDSFRYAIKKGRLHLQTNDVVVMDEAGMTDSVSMESILHSVTEAGAKLVLVGDHAQLQPVGAGSSFRALIERLGFAEIQTIYRQKVAWQREATAYFAAGQIAQGLALYRDSSSEAIRFEEKSHEAMQTLVSDWAASVKSQENGLKQSMMMAYRNVDVTELNRLAREVRLASGEISQGYRMKTAENGEIHLSVGDRIMLLKNDRALALSNGRLATVVSIDMTESGVVNKLTLLPDGVDKPVTINPHKYNDIAYGYAATVHKLQGATFDKSFAYVGGYGWDRHLTYVMMTRHRESVQLYADKETYADYDALTKALSKHGMKDSVMDFPLHFAERRGLENSTLMRLLPEKLAIRLNEKLEKIHTRYSQWINPNGFAHAAQKATERMEKAEKRQTQREDARLVAAYIDATREVVEYAQLTGALVESEPHYFGGSSNLHTEKIDY